MIRNKIRVSQISCVIYCTALLNIKNLLIIKKQRFMTFFFIELKVLYSSFGNEFKVQEKIRHNDPEVW